MLILQRMICKVEKLRYERMLLKRQVMKFFMSFLFLIFCSLIIHSQNEITSPDIRPENSTSLNFTSSNLPIFLINTNYQEIPDEPKISASLGIIYNGEGTRNSVFLTPNHYNGLIGIELRGNSTQHYPKKPYAFETRDSLGENYNVSLFGLPKENDWILRASYFDHTFIRNPLACHMSRLMGRWASHCQMVELVLNGEYQGIYILMEKIKPDIGRLDIAKLLPDQITQPEISGGYIYEITGFESNLGQSRNLKYPDYDEAAPQQIAYIKQYDNVFRNVMNSSYFSDKTNGYYAWIDVASFVDELLVQEGIRNSDAYGWSGYFHKDREAKICAGPVWDFDQSAGNSSYPDDGVVTGWMFSHPGTTNTPFFWPLLFNDPVFSYQVRKRWEELRMNEFKTTNLLSYIDSIANLLSEAQSREFEKWPVLGQFIWRETSGYEFRTTYQDEVDYLKSFLMQRWSWMDTELARIDNPTTIFENNYHLLTNILVYPNPATDYLIFNLSSENQLDARIEIYDCLGVLVQNNPSVNINEGENKLLINLNELIPGIYLYKIIAGTKEAYNGRFTIVSQ